MPNHVTNRLRINGTPEQVQTVREAINGVWEKEPDTPRHMDFEKILPMPEGLHIEEREREHAEWLAEEGRTDG